MFLLKSLETMLFPKKYDLKPKRLTATKGHREIQNYKRDFYIQHRLSSH